jgi:hypothetical protein
MDSTDNQPVHINDTVGNLWRFYEEHASQARQHENLRATVTSILSSIAAAMVGLAGLGGLDLADVPAGIVVVLLALLGVSLSIKHYERNRLHARIMGAVRREITRIGHDSHAIPKSTQEIREDAEEEHAEKFAVLKRQQARKSVWPRIPLHVLWLGPPLAIGLVGVLVLVLSFVGVSK